MEAYPMDLLNNSRSKEETKKLSTRRPAGQINGNRAFSDFIEFWFLMFVAILDSVVGVFILAYSTWSYIRKAYLYSKVFRMGIDMSYFTIIGSIVAIFSPWITVKICRLRLEYVFALISMELVEIVVLITGLSIGNVYLPNHTNTSMTVRVTVPGDVLNESMRTLIQSYSSDNDSKIALDRIQSTLWCCGNNKKEDYIKNELVMPDSCCPMGNCTQNKAFPGGCRIPVQRDIAWHNATLSSLATMLIIFYVPSIFIALGVFFSEASKLKNQSKSQNQMSFL